MRWKGRSTIRTKDMALTPRMHYEALPRSDERRSGGTREWSRPPALNPPSSLLVPSPPSFASVGLAPFDAQAEHNNATSYKTSTNSSATTGCFDDAAGAKCAFDADVGNVVDIDELLRIVSVIDDDGGRKCYPRKAAVEGKLALPRYRSSPIAAAVVQSEADINGTMVAAKKRRCGTIILAGPATRRGFCASSMSQCACDRLRCTECDFDVLWFNCQAWGDDIDYIFLRNNAPDPVKLSARLRPSSATCAYACQCSWQNVEDLRALSPAERPRWACRGHC